MTDYFLPESGVTIYSTYFDVDELSADEAVMVHRLAVDALRRHDPDWWDCLADDPEEWGGEYSVDVYDVLAGELAWLATYYPHKTENEIINMLTGVDRFA